MKVHNKKHIFLLLFSSIICTTSLLKGMDKVSSSKVINYIDYYKSEGSILDLNNMHITPDFLKENQKSLRDFIFDKSVCRLDLQRNGLKHIPVCILAILLEEKSPLKEINIVFPKFSVGHKGFGLIAETFSQEYLCKIQSVPDGLQLAIPYIGMSFDDVPTIRLKVTKK